MGVIVFKSIGKTVYMLVLFNKLWVCSSLSSTKCAFSSANFAADIMVSVSFLSLSLVSIWLKYFSILFSTLSIQNFAWCVFYYTKLGLEVGSLAKTD
jgi:hypothetical protein